MPIYAYKCSACGFAKDALQKMSDAPLTVCPECGASTFQKQVTAAGFQLKGSGWYVTDFREGNGKKGADKPSATPADAAASPATETASAKPADTGAAAASTPAPAPAPAAAPAASKSD